MAAAAQLAIVRARNLVVGRKAGSGGVFYSVSDRCIFKLLDVIREIFDNQLIEVRDMLREIRRAS
jgi:hypothetical protein